MYQVELELAGSETRNKYVVWNLAGQCVDLAEINKAASEEFPGIPRKDLKFHFVFFPDQKGLFALRAMVMAPLHSSQ